MSKIPPFIFSMLLLSLAALPAAGQDWRDIGPGDAVRLPEHLYFQKDYRIQWWYVTGHLFDASGREFGYQLTFFAAGVQQRVYESEFGVNFIYLSHVAVTDVAENRYYHFSNADSGAYAFAGAESKRMRVWLDKASLEGSLQRMHIRAHAGDLGLDLSLVPGKPVVLHGREGYSRKSETSPSIASLYFSLTDLKTTGIVTIGKRKTAVAGKSWFDREISSRGLADNDAGWDWFSIKLDDRREVMLYRIRNRDGAIDPYSSGTIVNRDGTYRHLTNNDYSVKILDRYTSRHTEARYPSKWEVMIPSEKVKLVITPLVRDQEFTEARAIRRVYWEGTCRVEGSVTGRAYVEMTGYE